MPTTCADRIYWPMSLLVVGGIILGLFAVLLLLHFLSYGVFKKRILKRQMWGLNISCGKTDGGGVNADIVKHIDVPNFQLVDDIYNLPFASGQFSTVLCSHTIEHVEDPEAFFAELSRVGDDVTIVLPPLWDPLAVLAVFEHRWIFLTFRKEHTTLPRFVRLPLARTLQNLFGQRLHA